ncbi:acyltransferase [Clostridium sp. M62/1]|uniref:acyltransferase family protein n=1 Tax=Clostridium sp. M62/1 TaxID=411486 RepID=UPI0001973748|nr:acyltransferase [Clostridium sp. M62/1]EFE14049.1 acyltransferase [Clostridium sp. M62/1]UEB80291.1 acyltransferase [Clostridium sp. M62/1]
MIKNKEREIWVDNIKVIACTLVLLGHFFQSMVSANLMPANDLYQWFNQTIYYFHVPLFFICSGYLYQKLSKVNNITSWAHNILKKAINLGVPYFTFSFLTWAMKTIFSGSTNSSISGLGETLFFKPTGAYWYLYALFFIFLITPTFRNRRMNFVGFVIALILKFVSIICGGFGVNAISYVLSNEIWFVIGMCLNAVNFEVWDVGKIKVSIVTGIVFLALSIVVYLLEIDNGLIGFLLGLLACGSIIVGIYIIYKNRNQSVLFAFLSKYTMPIFVMHTPFAAMMRIVLLRLGIYNLVPHFILGIGISFAGPIIAAFIMHKSKWLEFFLYPGKLIKMKF